MTRAPRVPAALARLFAVVFVLLAGASLAAAQSAREAEVLSQALREMREGDWDAARSTARGAGAIGADIIEWHYLRGANGTFDETLAFLNRRPDWPGLAFLRERSEPAVPKGSRAAEVVAFFDGNPPQTGTGAIALISAYLAQGREAEAEALAIETWRTRVLSEQDEALLLDRYGQTLLPHHRARLDMLLWEDQRPGAERMYPRGCARRTRRQPGPCLRTHAVARPQGPERGRSRTDPCPRGHGRGARPPLGLGQLARVARACGDARGRGAHRLSPRVAARAHRRVDLCRPRMARGLPRA
ncbi:MAG: hypothetical protein MUF63_08390, partial [Rhodobacteraceae bacterium]|nr:hypothetical protein [Paracoccaceae bacterium]